MSETFRIEFEGQAFDARSGETVASALAGHGIKSLRITARGAERGIFCGMGVCQECLVTIDDVPGQRACMTRIDRPMRVRKQSAEGQASLSLSPQPSQPMRTIEDYRVDRPSILVIGAGPGGLAAAIAARSAGADVLVVDERSAPGGQYFKPLMVSGQGAAPPDAQHREGTGLVRQALGLGVEIRTGCTVWGAAPPGEFAATDGSGTYRILPASTIVATGAYERAWPVPGWTLPGVMTTGAAQTLWRTARRLPGKRVMIAGNGPLNLQLAAELARGGAEIIGLAEAAPPIGATSSGRLAAMAFLSPRLVFDGAGYQATLRRKGIKRFNRALAASVRPSDTALLVTLAFPSLNRPPLELETDILCLGYGFEPSNEILRALGCEHDVGATGQLRARRDEWCRTSLDGVYALGDCTGLGGARLALAEGTLAGLDAAARLGHGTASQVAAAARRQVERHRRFQHHLWKLYSCQPDWLPLAKPDTLICRCEDVTFGDLSAGIGSGIVALPALKQRSRVGMGPCQGRYCRPLIEEIIRRETGQAPTQFSGFAPRMPLKPIAVGELARTGGSLDGE